MINIEDRWFIFGELGNEVNISDGENDLFMPDGSPISLPRDIAEALIKAHNEYANFAENLLVEIQADLASEHGRPRSE